MNVLGVIGLGENPGACLVQDGRLVAMAEEERFTRLKGSHGFFPSRSAAWCLEHAGIGLGDVDRIAFPWDSGQYPLAVGWRFARTFLGNRLRVGRSHRTGQASSPFATAGEVLFRWQRGHIEEKIREHLQSVGLVGDLPPVEYVPHHLAHAYSTFFMSGFERAGVLTIDGSGERTATQLAIGEGDTIRIVDHLEIPNSLGWFYAALTQYMGFLPYRDEGKLMGLAALGEARSADNRFVEPLSKVLRAGDRGYEVDPIYTHFGGHSYGDRFTDSLADLLTAVDPDARPIRYGEKAEVDGGVVSRYLLPHYVDLAWAAQELLERAAVPLARRLLRDHGLEDLCLAGGVCLNCKMNGELLRQSGARRVFVQPAANDTGSALGAAFWVSQQMGASIHQPMDGPYYGPGFEPDAIRKALDGCGVRYTEVGDASTAAAELIDQGKLIAWFQGRMEFGARALGGRSILASPLGTDARDRVNRDVKYRESWRPFCPSMIDGVEGDYLEGAVGAAHMLVAFSATELCHKELPAVVHVDGTVRPQVVTERANPRFHALIEEVGRRSGHPVVLNTSFNVRGEPIVCTPIDAVRCFFSNGLQALVIGDFVVSK